MASLRVLSALGPGGRAPLFAAHDGCAPVVLGRVPPPGLEQVRSPYVTVPIDAVAAGERAFGVYPYVDGADLEALVERHPDGLPGPWAAAVAADLLEGLTALEAAGLGHGGVREAAVRIGTDGIARWVDVRGGAPSPEDVQALADLLERAVHPDAADAIAAMVEARDVAGLRAAAHRRAAPPVQATYPTDVVLEAEERSGPPAAPPKLVVARIGVLILALGLAMGWMMAPRQGVSAVEVEVPGAQVVELRCDARGCTVDATFADGRASGRLDATAGPSTCVRSAGTLECSASSP